MFLCHASVSHDSREKLAALSPEAYTAHRELVKCDLPVENTKEALSSWAYYTDRILSDVEVEAWTSMGVQVHISKMRGLQYVGDFDKAAYRSAFPGHGLSAPTVVNVSVAGIGLLQITEVDWMEDACTQELQTRLDEGWRILAVCPPNDSRRPTYIIGRSPGWQEEKERREGSTRNRW